MYNIYILVYIYTHICVALDSSARNLYLGLTSANRDRALFLVAKLLKSLGM